MNQIKLLFFSIACLLGVQFSNAQGTTCATAVAVTPGTYTAAALTGTGATHAPATAAAWYKFTPATSGLLGINSCGGGADTRLWVMSGACGTFTAVATNDDFAACISVGTDEYASSISNVILLAGTTYYFEWDNRWENTGFNWSFTFAPLPNNDVQFVSANEGVEYSVIHVRQALSGTQLNFSATGKNGAALTNSAVTATVVVKNSANATVYTATSAPQSLAINQTATFTMAPYTVTVVDDYTIEYTITGTGTDQFPTNNTGTDFFTRSVDYMARNYGITGSLGIGNNATVGVYDNGILGQTFTLSNPDQLDSIFFVLNAPPAGVPVRVDIYNTTAMGVPTGTPIASTTSYTTTTADNTDGVALILPIASGTLNLAAGTYYFGVIEQAGNITLATSPKIFTADKTFLKWDTNPAGAAVWSNNEDFGFNVVYVLSPVFKRCLTANVSALAGTNATCNTATGTATASSTGGTGSFSYVWDNGATTATTATLTPGSHVVTATDGNFCATTATATVGSTNAPITVLASATFTSCTSNTGTATASPTSGVAPYTFVWNNGQMVATATGLASGGYTVTATDASGCFGTANANVVTPGGPTATQTPTNVNCFGNNNGAINVTPTGGTGALTYAWSNGATTQDLAGLTPGTYSTTITDAANCAFSISNIVVTQPTAMVATVATATNVGCFGQTNGAIDINVSGGNSNYIYLWSNNATTQDLTGLSAGTFSALVGDTNGCTATIPATTITAPNAALGLTGLPTITNILCFGQTGSITGVAAVVSGGTTPYTYLWSNGAATADVTGLSIGTYTGTVTDAHGCTFVSPSVSITGPTSAVTAAPTQVNITCNGAGNGSINTNATGGTAPLTYIWNNGATTANLTNLAFGPYRCTITDANGCSLVTSNIQITQPTPLNASGAITDQTNIGANDGAINVSVSGGAAPYSYVWSNGATTQDVSGIGAGAFSVTITDTNGCTNTQSFNVITGVNGIASLNLFDVMPNPTSDILNVNIELNRVSDVRLELYSAAGQVIMTQGNPDVSAQQYQFNLSDLPVGVYFLRLSAGESNVVKRIIVNR